MYHHNIFDTCIIPLVCWLDMWAYYDTSCMFCTHTNRIIIRIQESIKFKWVYNGNRQRSVEFQIN
jgi:predicted DCC family thiol-disulfide oxidoreductase YuxK